MFDVWDFPHLAALVRDPCSFLRTLKF
jgi:hypothetical protein